MNMGISWHVQPMLASKQRAEGDMRDKSVTCTNCKRSGHEAADCFQLVGYPELWGDRPRDAKLAGRGRGNATEGQGRGGGHRANAVQLMPESNTTANIANRGVPDLDIKRSASLLELLNSHKANSVEKMIGKNSNTS